jgi:hypothetical protein
VTATTKDGPRYKAIGNSMAVPVMRWIVVGIAVVISARLIVDIVINTLSATGTIDANTLNTIKSAK